MDPRTLEPLDTETLLASVRKTGRLVVTDESHDNCGVAAGLAALMADLAFDSLKAPIKRVAIPHVPVPFAVPMEDYVTPTADAHRSSRPVGHGIGKDAPTHLDLGSSAG